MIRLSVEVWGRGKRFTTDVQAQSIIRAVSLATARHPGCKVQVIFPIDPETFFTAGDGRASGTTLLESSRPGTLSASPIVTDL
jgi:hypothetical protein